MNTSYQMDDDVLVATARIQAALEIVPRIVGPKKVWGPWMRDHLKVEEVRSSAFPGKTMSICVLTFLEKDPHGESQLSTSQASRKP